jgi:hypothetical protein
MDSRHFDRRKFVDSDYESVVALHNATYPDHLVSVASLRNEDRVLALPSDLNPRFVVDDVRSGELVALGALWRKPYQDDPARPWVRGMVRADH